MIEDSDPATALRAAVLERGTVLASRHGSVGLERVCFVMTHAEMSSEWGPTPCLGIVLPRIPCIP